MFADSPWGAGWANRSHRGWTTLISFALEALAVGMSLLFPLIHPENLPPLQWSSPWVAARTLVAPAAAGDTPLTHLLHARPQHGAGAGMVAPSHIPTAIAAPDENKMPEAPNPGSGDGVLNSIPFGSGRSGVPDSVGIAAVAVPPVHHDVEQPHPVSHMMEGNLIHRVQPVYPLVARQAGIQGTVVLQAVISRSGAVENLEAVSGHPMLVKAAMDAVRQWRYRPYFLNDQPVEVETQVTVIFILSHE